MPSLDDLKNQLNKGSSSGNAVTFSGSSLAEVLKQASEHFGVSEEDLSYETLEEKTSGKFLFKKKEISASVWVNENAEKTAHKVVHEPKDTVVEEVVPKKPVKKDGHVKVVIRKSGVFLKVSAPIGEGKRVSFGDVQVELSTKGLRSVDADILKPIINEQSGEEVKIMEWRPNPEYDSKASVEISPDRMQASLIVTAPILSGRVLEIDEIKGLLEANGVTYGVKDNLISKIFEDETFNTPVIVAEGIPGEHGKDAYIDYKFITDTSQIKYTQDESGTINYKERNLVQNVVAGQVLAEKIPQTPGIPGRTVTNEKIEVRDGQDIPFEIGKNVKLSEDKLQVVSDIPGQAVLVAGKITVEPVYEVKGNVSLETGNIVFLGNVVVHGDVEDGFSVKAAGNIEVKGNVGKCELDAEHDVIINLGILGKNESIVKAGHDVYARMIENVKIIKAGNDVIIREEILHSNIDAGSRILCHGQKKGQIVGGKLRASQEVSAKTIGSISGTETKIEAGTDPSITVKMSTLETEKTEILEGINKLVVSINHLQSQKETAPEAFLPKNQDLLDKMLRAKKEYEFQLNEINQDIDEIRNYLATIEKKGKVSAKNIVYPGVDITINEANLRVRNDFRSVTFKNENNYIKSFPYEEFEGAEKLNPLDRKR